MVTRNEIKLVHSLADKKGRAEHGLFVVEGEKLITEIVRSQIEIVQLYRVNENCTWIEMNRMSTLKTPSRELAVARIPDWKATQLKCSKIRLALDSIQDPGNLGSIIRTADWFGINTIYCSVDSADCFAPKVVQSTMGSIGRVEMIYCDLREILSHSPLPIFGTFLEHSSNIYSVTPANEFILVMGNEGRGISPEIEALVSQRLHIPRTGNGESLNVAAAAAISIALLSGSPR